MTIATTVRRPGVYNEFLVDNRGTVQVVPVRLAVVAIKSSAGTATANVGVQVLDEDSADLLAGRGSQAALMLRASMTQGQRSGVGTPEIWLVPIAAPAGAAATQTMTVTVTTSLAGEVVFRIAGRTLVASVAAGDTPTTIALAMKAAVDAAVKILPVTASVAAGVLTLTAVHPGVHGNDIAYQVVSLPSGVSVASAAGVTGAGVVDITATLDEMLNRDYDAIVLGNHGATDVSDAIAHNSAAWSYEQQRYRHVVIGERGTLATANGLAVAANHKTVVVVGCEGCPNLPGEIAAMFASAAWGKTNSGGVMPNANLDDERLYLFPPSSIDTFSAAEQESALSAGVTPLVATDDGQAVSVIRAVTTKTLVNGSFDEGEYDLSRSRTQAYVAKRVSTAIKANHRQEVQDLALLDRIRDTVLAEHRKAAALVPPVLVDVERLKEEMKVAYAAAPAGRVVVDGPFKPADPHHQTVITHRQIVGID